MLCRTVYAPGAQPTPVIVRSGRSSPAPPLVCAEQWSSRRPGGAGEAVNTHIASAYGPVMSQTTRPPTAPRPGDLKPLGLRNILTDLLPRTVHTPGGPERYTVAAVFTRRPTVGEIDAINGPAMRRWLQNARYPGVTVQVSDRRLEIANTNLEELAGGLAGVIAGLLGRISATDEENAHAVADDLVDRDEREAQRTASVRELVDAIALRDAEPAADADELGLSRIVAGLLPSTLETEFASRRYTVTAEFTRAPTATELEMIAGPLARTRLDDVGYRDAALKVRDRRLEIHDTNLGELADGLATVVADLLAEITRAAIVRDAAEAAEAAGLAQHERERAEYVAAAAAAISFVTPPEPSRRPVTADGSLSSDPSGLGAWEDEGGSAVAARQGMHRLVGQRRTDNVARDDGGSR